MQAKIWSVIVWICLSLSARAQQVQWASKVVSFSTEVSLVEYGSDQILGPPDVLPKTEISPNAWSPGNSRKEHFITVAFDHPMTIRQTAIAEAYNAGSLKEVIAIDSNEERHLLYTLTPEKSAQTGRMFNFFLSETDFQVAALELRFDGKLFGGKFYVDAVAISDSDIPVRAEVDRHSLVRRGLAVEELGSNINSSSNEIRPVLSPDGRTLYFSRQFHPDNMNGSKDREDIWQSHWDDQANDWTPATNLGAPLNTTGENFVSAASAEGESTLLLLGSDYERKKVRRGVSVSSDMREGWTEPVTIPFNTGFTISGEFDFDLSPDRKTMIFAFRQPDTYGNKDLYVSFLLRSGIWSEPLNLGPIINSVGEEASPFLDSDGSTLYFSSNGLKGYGGHDIYVANRLDDTWTNWSIPQNLGPDINSIEDEKYFNIPNESNYAYMSRYTGAVNADIYRIELPLYEPQPAAIANTEEPFTFPGINFVSNQAMLLPEAFEDLNQIIAYLEENPTLLIEVSSHTDNIGTEADNLELSKLRAEAIFDYLTGTGNLSPDRIILRWFGELKPIATNETPEGRRQNRRVEFRIRR